MGKVVSIIWFLLYFPLELGVGAFLEKLEESGKFTCIDHQENEIKGYRGHFRKL